MRPFAKVIGYEELSHFQIIEAELIHVKAIRGHLRRSEIKSLQRWQAVLARVKDFQRQGEIANVFVAERRTGS